MWEIKYSLKMLNVFQDQLSRSYPLCRLHHKKKRNNYVK